MALLDIVLATALRLAGVGQCPMLTVVSTKQGVAELSMSTAIWGAAEHEARHYDCRVDRDQNRRCQVECSAQKTRPIYVPRSLRLVSSTLSSGSANYFLVSFYRH
jgi:hypothetical protein